MCVDVVDDDNDAEVKAKLAEQACMLASGQSIRSKIIRLTCISDDMRITNFESQSRLNMDSGVHAGDHCH